MRITATFKYASFNELHYKKQHGGLRQTDSQLGGLLMIRTIKAVYVV